MHDTAYAIISVEGLGVAGERPEVGTVAAVQLPPDKVSTKLSWLFEVS